MEEKDKNLKKRWNQNNAAEVISPVQTFKKKADEDKEREMRNPECKMTRHQQSWCTIF